MLPNNALSVTPIPSFFLPPRQVVRFSAIAGLSDQHFGGVQLGDSSQGLSYQIWTAFINGTNVEVTAPNQSSPTVILTGVQADWVGLAFDQNGRPFITYAYSKTGAGFYYWFDTLLGEFVTTAIPGFVPRAFAALDDIRPAQSNTSDIILAYVRAGSLYMRVQRDRFGIEYNLGAVPATLVQIGMNHVLRFQFAFQNVQGDKVLPPVEYSPNLGINEPA